jgi:hypothetical protein
MGDSTSIAPQNTVLSTQYSRNRALAYKSTIPSEWKTAISINRLDDLFRSVLHKERIDQSWSSEHQVSEVFNKLLKNLVVKRET